MGRQELKTEARAQRLKGDVGLAAHTLVEAVGRVREARAHPKTAAESADKASAEQATRLLAST